MRCGLPLIGFALATGCIANDDLSDPVVQAADMGRWPGSSRDTGADAGGHRGDAGGADGGQPTRDAAPDAPPADVGLEIGPDDGSARDGRPGSAHDGRPAADAASIACQPPPDDLPEVEISRQERFETLHGFPGGAELLPRDITVYLPADYDASPQTDYPVLYMHDGQNLFDPSLAAFGMVWQVDEILDSLVDLRIIEPHIVVGIHSTTDRGFDYTPDVDPQYGGGGAPHYEALVVDRIKPFIDNRYRVRCDPASTALLGSSHGGLVSCDTMLRHPGVFGRVGCVSTSFWWNDESLLRRLADAGVELPARVWIDGGGAEGDIGPSGISSVIAHARTAIAHLRQHGRIHGRHLGGLDALGAEHNELAWAQRLGSILAYLLGDVDYAAQTPVRVVVEPYRDRIGVGEHAAVAVTAEYVDGARLTWPHDLAHLRVEPADAGRFAANGHLEGAAGGTATILAEINGVRGEGVVQIVDEIYPVTFDVTVPGGQGPIVVVGNLDALGAWLPPQGLELERNGNGHFVGQIGVLEGTTFEYKYTQGSWETVEKAANGDELPNRVAVVDGPLVLEDTVLSWRVD